VFQDLTCTLAHRYDDSVHLEKIFFYTVIFPGAKLWVIEVNPFLETTDGALFSWNHERNILEGSQGFVFRITEKPRPGAKTILPQSVKGLLEDKTI
jgi:hypothetical protein